MLRAILNKFWRQHPTRHQLYDHLLPITKTIQVRRTTHACHSWRSRDDIISDVLLWTPSYGRAKAGRPARTYIQQLCEDTGCGLEDRPEAMTIGRSGEKGSGIFVLVARHDDDEYDDDVCLNKYIKYIGYGWVGFYGIITIIGNLMPHTLHTYISNICLLLPHFLDSIFKRVCDKFFFIFGVHLNCFKYCYPIRIILFTLNHLFARS